MNLRQLEKLRAQNYGIAPAKRIRTMPDAARFIHRLGFCWLFAPAHSSRELPSLFEAMKGKRGMQINDWDSDAEKIWVWKNDLPAAHRAYYGKALAGKPALVSLEMLPNLLATAGEADLEQLYTRGGISYEARKIYHALDSLGPQPTMALRAAAGLDGKDGNNRYHRALDELQRKLYVMPIGATNERGNWPSQIFELVARWFPEHAARARELDLREAQTELVTRYLKTVLAAQPATIARLFGIERAVLDSVLAELVTRGQARFEEGWIVKGRVGKFAG